MISESIFTLEKRSQNQKTCFRSDRRTPARKTWWKGGLQDKEYDLHIRDADARSPTLAQNCMTTRTEAKTVAAATEPVECRKISMKGKVVGVSRAPSTSVKLKSVAISMPKAKLPLMTMVNMIARGTTTEASWISSDIYHLVSLPLAFAPLQRGYCYVNGPICACSPCQTSFRDLLTDRIDHAPVKV